MNLYQYAKKDEASQVKIELNNKLYEFNIADELEFENDLDGNLARQAVSVSLLMNLYESIQEQVKVLNTVYEYKLSTEWLRIKNTYSDKTGKPFSDSRVDKEVSSNEEFKQMKIELIKLEVQAKRLKSYIELFVSKERLMQTYSSNLRHISN